MKLILFGNSELAKLYLYILNRVGRLSDGYIVDEKLKKKDVLMINLYTKRITFYNFNNENVELFICIGDLKINKLREEKYNFFKKGF